MPVDLEDMVYTFEQIPSAPATGPMPNEALRGRVAGPAEGMRVLTYAMTRDRAEHIIGIGQRSGFQPRGLLACGGAASKLVSHVPSLMKARTDGAVAVIDIGHERTDVVVVYQNKAVFSRSISDATTLAGWFGFPRTDCGARNGESVSTRSRSWGTSRTDSRSSPAPG